MSCNSAAECRALTVINHYATSYIWYKRVRALFDLETRPIPIPTGRKAADQKGLFGSWVLSEHAVMVTISIEPFTVVWVNPAFEKLYGYTREDVVGRTPKVLQGLFTNHGVALNKKIQCAGMLNGGFTSVTTRRMVNHTKHGDPVTVNLHIALHDLTPIYRRLFPELLDSSSSGDDFDDSPPAWVQTVAVFVTTMNETKVPFVTWW